MLDYRMQAECLLIGTQQKESVTALPEEVIIGNGIFGTYWESRSFPVHVHVCFTQTVVAPIVPGARQLIVSVIESRQQKS